MWQGLLAGAVGTAVMTVGEKLEQRCTGRPDSQVPGAVLARLTGSRLRGNLVMHFGQGALAGVVRALMANAGLRGPVASAMFTVVRLSNDQILENATGVGAPPQTWPRRELAVDLLHKTVYGFATGLVADALAARRGPGPGQRHASLRPGRQPDVGPAGGE
ncbi:hypothetical protein GCM10023214_51290 [Amycolatopsis dongchuanensis]|uniref:Uncharacterized protein n=1 Tax=Amycolatopsis dongchuanensis TaxID=1070866 RepID=A0ABP9R483_9PSEU